ncbi:hypothetical protein [Pantoea agglomerans]|uniref:hypothetical protein n=1 Tax=Enterobacter agglomerans TaxID=549 RepID=UPI0012DB3661|nr:hypothetical protein [Pantoea agglomerans]
MKKNQSRCGFDAIKSIEHNRANIVTGASIKVRPINHPHRVPASLALIQFLTGRAK